MSLDTMDDSRHCFEPPELTDREVAQSIVESGEDNVPIFKDLQELEQLLAEDDIGTSDQPAAQIHDTTLLEPSMQELESTLSEARATLQGSLGRTAAAERAAAAREAAKRDAAAADAASEQREREAKARAQELAERQCVVQALWCWRCRASLETALAAANAGYHTSMRRAAVLCFSQQRAALHRSRASYALRGWR